MIRRLPPALVLAGALALPLSPLSGQEPADSAELLHQAQEKQRDFERYRESRLPPAFQNRAFHCDDLVGRLCLIQDEDEDEALPAEPPEVGLARGEMMRTLAELGGRLPGDRWILGQRIYYLAEVGSWREARHLLDDCRSDSWWCATLQGYVSQRMGESDDAAAAFQEAFGTMPQDVEARFRQVRQLLDRDGQGFLDGLSEDEKKPFLRTLWVLSDPLYLVDGNDRLVEHWTRVTGTLIREDAEQTYDLPWGDDMGELLLRYGQEVGWTRERSLEGAVRGQDTRSVVGHQASHERQFVPPTDVFKDPIATPVGAWTLEERAPFTGYTPSYAPEIRGLDAQVGRFRRGDSLLVVAAYRPAKTSTEAPVADEDRAPKRADRRADPFGPLAPPGVAAASRDDGAQITGPVESGIFLLDPDGTVVGQEKGTTPSGVWSTAVPDGRYILGLEVFASEDRSAWRTRGGVAQAPLAPGLTAVSDVLLLKGGEPVPETLDEALPRVLPTTRVGQNQNVAVAWEVYGLRPNQSASVRVGFTRHREGVLARLGQFLRIVETEEPIVVSFQDSAPGRLGTVFRAINVGLPGLDPGDYDILVEVDLPGRDPMASSRRITVTAAGGG